MDTPPLTITLKPDVAEQLAQLTTQQSEADDLVDQALRAYLARFRREKIHQEAEAFQKQRAALLRQFAGQYVAIHNGQVIDHDADLRTLHLRVFARLGHTPVLLKQVKEAPDRELVFRSPRWERMEQ